MICLAEARCMQYRPQSADDSAYDLTGKRGDVLQTCVPEQEGSAHWCTRKQSAHYQRFKFLKYGEAMRFTLRQIEYFIATAETGSITLASERLNISQPSISTAISHLELELETQLFVRYHAKGLSLTPAGRALLAEAKRLVDQAEQMYAVAS